MSLWRRALTLFTIYRSNHFVLPWSLASGYRARGVSEERHSIDGAVNRGNGISLNMKEIDTDERESPTWCPQQQIYIGGIVPDNAEVDALLSENNGRLRIFGYGSLCWNPGQGAVLSAPGVTTSLGRARGYKRCWAQRSADHRGTPQFPGIVCTLLNDDEVRAIREQEQTTEGPPTMTEGLIYTVPPELVDDCLSELDFREKGGYARDVIDVVEDETGETVQALLYRGTPDNPAFWKRALLDLPFAAATMAVSVGPSGKNDEYLYNLDHFLSDAASTSPAVAAALLDHTGDTDTGSLASMARKLQQRQLYFLFGSGSNQHNQLMLSSTNNGASLMNGDEARELKEIVLCTPQAGTQTSERILDKPMQLYAGGGHSGLLTVSGNLYLWGWNNHGQLGSSRTASESSPLLTVSALKGIKVKSASLGYSHTLVIERDTGFLFGFGDNERGQVSGSIDDSTISEPVRPFGEARFVDSAAGLFHSAAISEEGDLATFGCGRFGQSLSSTTDTHTVGKNVLERRWRPKDGSRLVRVACGRRHTVILDEHGRVWTMGENKHGQLGRALSNSSNGKWDAEPQLVDGRLGSSGSGCYEVSCGWSHTVVTLKTKTDGREAYGWGRNDKGQLGTGFRSSLFVPTSLFNGTNLKKLVCASEFTMALDDSGTVYGCGWNEHGNLSLGNTKDTLGLSETTGARVTTPPHFSSRGEKVIAAGGAHFLTMVV